MCLRDDKNTARVCISSPSLAMAGKPGKRHAKRAHIGRKLFLIG